jgi:hypothetical protein
LELPSDFISALGAIGSIAGARSLLGKNLPTACIAASGKVLGANVKTIDLIDAICKRLKRSKSVLSRVVNDGVHREHMIKALALLIDACHQR